MILEGQRDRRLEGQRGRGSEGQSSSLPAVQPSSPPVLQPSKLLLSSAGFLILEVMVASLILTAGVAATMYLFRMGFQYLEHAKDSNLLSSKLPQVVNYMKVLDMDVKSGTEDMGDNVIMHWDAKLLETVRPSVETGGSFQSKVPSSFNLYLYKVSVRLDHNKFDREYEINVFRSSRVAGLSAPGF